MTRAVALTLLLAAAAGWMGLVAPARLERDRARTAFARARQEREGLRSEVAGLERRSGGGRTPKDAAEASRTLRRAFLLATDGLPVTAVQIAVSGGGSRAGVGPRGTLAAEGRQADLLRLADRLFDPARGVRVERVSLSEARGEGRPARIEVQGGGVGTGS